MEDSFAANGRRKTGNSYDYLVQLILIIDYKNLLLNVGSDFVDLRFNQSEKARVDLRVVQ